VDILEKILVFFKKKGIIIGRGFSTPHGSTSLRRPCRSRRTGCMGLCRGFPFAGCRADRPFIMQAFRRSPVVCLLAITFLLLAAPPSVYAGCGDYLVRGTAPSHHAATAQTQSAASATPASSSPVVPGHPSSPCSGPNCSSRQLPPPAPPASVEGSVDQWACPVGVAVIFDREFITPLGAEERETPRHHSLMIYHPPRYLLA
jgi:hypothetical protein